MRGTILYGPGDIRFEDRDGPENYRSRPTPSSAWPPRASADRTSGRIAACSRCDGTDADGPRILRHRRRGRQRGQDDQAGPVRRRLVLPLGQHLRHCQYGYQSSCVHREFMSGAQAPFLRVPLADGTLVADAGRATRRSDPSLLATSDVLGTGWFAADAANVKPGSTVVVVGDGAVGLLGVLSARQMGAERIIAMSRHESRQKLAREFGATDIVTERGDEGVARIKELTKGIGADSVLECVGTQESMMQAIRSTRPGGFVSYVGVPHGVELDGAGAVLHSRASARRPGAGAPLPA